MNDDRPPSIAGRKPGPRKENAERYEPKLSSAQHDLVAAHVHLVDLVARSTCRMLRNLDLDDARHSAHEGLVRAAQTYDPSAGSSFAQHATLRMRWFVQDEARKERGQRAKARALAREAGLGFADSIQPDENLPFATQPELEQRFGSLARGFALAAVAGLAGNPVDALEAGEQEVVDGETRERLRAKLNAAVADLNERDRALFVAHYFEGRQLKDIATDESISYATIRRRHHAALMRVASRVRG